MKLLLDRVEIREIKAPRFVLRFTSRSALCVAPASIYAPQGRWLYSAKHAATSASKAMLLLFPYVVQLCFVVASREH